MEKKVISVKQEYQTHPWSKDNGGFVVLVEKLNRILRYENVKNVEAYASSVLRYGDDVLRISTVRDDGTAEVVWERK